MAMAPRTACPSMKAIRRAAKARCAGLKRHPRPTQHTGDRRVCQRRPGVLFGPEHRRTGRQYPDYRRRGVPVPRAVHQGQQIRTHLGVLGHGLGVFGQVLPDHHPGLRRYGPEPDGQFGGGRVTWYSPLGPLSFNLAYPIRTPENAEKQIFQFSMGQTF